MGTGRSNGGCKLRGDQRVHPPQLNSTGVSDSPPYDLDKGSPRQAHLISFHPPSVRQTNPWQRPQRPRRMGAPTHNSSPLWLGLQFPFAFGKVLGAVTPSPFWLQLSEKFHAALSRWAPTFGGALILRESAVLVLHLQPWRIGRGEVFSEKFSSCADGIHPLRC